MVSMKDIANHLGISRCTVSNILNDKFEGHSYKIETIEAVRKAAKEMGYISNSIAKSLKTGSTKTIAVIVPDFANPFYINIVKEIERLANNDDFNLIVCMTEEKLEKEEKVLRMLKSRMVDGVIISPISYNESLKHHIDLPLICFDRMAKNGNYPHVIANNKEATCKLTEILIKKGKRKPIYMATAKDDYTIHFRIQGFFDALKKHDINKEERCIIYDVYNEVEAYNAVKNLIEKQNTEFDSIILSTNYVIYGVLRALKEYNRNDILLGGFDDFPGSALYSDNMVLAFNPEKEFALKSYELLFKLINHEKTKNQILKIIF